MPLQGKYALITGSSRGIGRGIALKLAESHAKLAIHYYQNETAARATLADIQARGAEGFLVQADVSRPEQIARMFRKVQAEFGRLDIFVSNARPEVPAFFQPPLEITLEQWDTAFDSQTKAFLIGVREALPLMGDGGRIFAITYGAGSRSGGLQPWGMGSAKAALESLVRYFAVTLARRGITVNAISPGWTEDSVFNTLPEQAQELFRAWHERGWTPAGRLGTPEDVGNVVSLFCSELAGWVTGQIVYADGGASFAWFDAIAPYHPTAVGVYSGLGRQPVPPTNREKNIAILYASYRVLNSLFPQPQFAATWNTMLTSVGLDPTDTSTDLNSPIGIGNAAGNAVVLNRERDGMNQLGDEGGRTYNRQPYADYLGYIPVNSAYKLSNPSRWQPLVTSSGNGLFTVQQFVTPQLRVVTPPTTLQKEW